jgi:hypothetical protein
LYSTKTKIIEGKTTTYMKYSFVYDASIADKLDSKKEVSIEQNSRGFSTVSDDIDHLRGAEKY